MPTIHAFDYLDKPEKHPPQAVNVLLGDESFLRRLVLERFREQMAEGRSEVQLTTFEPDAQWRDVADELSTSSLFGGGGKRLVMLEDADDFVSTHRQRLEDYVAKPKSSSILIIAVDSWPANTRLYKAIDQAYLQIQCAVPVRANSKNKDPDLPRLAKWIVTWAKKQHHLSLEGAAADELVQIVGPHLGLIDQDLAKLALYVPAGGKVSPALVKEVIGGWRLRTAWQMLDDAAEGKVAAALEELNHLLRSDAHPNEIFGPISYSLRRFANAVRQYENGERRRDRLTLPQALEAAGVRKFPPEALKKAEEQLKQLTRQRAGKLYHWLLETDLALKGSHSHKDRARLALEVLFLRLSHQLAPGKK